MRALLTGILAIASVACFELEDPLPPGEVRLLVHAVLDVGAPMHLVTVEQVDAGGNVVGGMLAGVYLIFPDGSEVRFAKDDNRGAYVAVPSPSNALVPGATYTLRVEAAGYDVVTGTTTIPAAPAAAPDTSTYIPFDMTRDTLRLSWARVPGAKSYHVLVLAKERVFGPGGGERYETRYSVFTDTSISLPGRLEVIEGGNVFFTGDSLAVVVSAVDDNYYTYYHSTIDPFAGAPPSRLSGGIGVFGSIVPLINRRYRVIVPQ